MRLQLNCPKCSKPLEFLSDFRLGTETFKTFKCGHAFVSTTFPELHNEEPQENLKLSSVDGTKKARPYQEQGVRFILGKGTDTGFDGRTFSEYGQIRGNSCILADQMRLGKTPQSLIALANLVAESAERGEEFPALILVRAANMYQWLREDKTWVDSLPDSCWLVQGTKNWIPPGFKVYLMSMDTFGRRGTCKLCKHQYHDEACTKKDCICQHCAPAGDAMSDILLEFGFKMVIVDEAHSFKNSDSQRTRALIAFLKGIERSTLVEDWNFQCPFDKTEWMERIEIKVSALEGSQRTSKSSHCPKCFTQVQQSAARHIKVERNCSIVMLTGTPIKNRAEEYFVPLNLIAPDRFPSIVNFRRKWLTQDSRGRFSRVDPYRMDAFKKEIAPFVLRREKEDVYTDVPKMNRIFTVITIEDERLKKAYNQVLDDIEAKHPSGDFSYFKDIGELQRLRQICGLAKVKWVADYAETFLLDSDRAKLAIGVHHHSVRDAMKMELSNVGCLTLDGTDSPQRKDYIAHKHFANAPEQILLLGMMAAKEGLELPYIDTALVMEREWSSSEEEQFEFRFYNPDKDYLKKRGWTSDGAYHNGDGAELTKTLENKVSTVEYILAKGTIDQFFYELVEEKRQIFGETVANNWDVTKESQSFRELMERTIAGRL